MKPKFPYLLPTVTSVTLPKKMNDDRTNESHLYALKVDGPKAPYQYQNNKLLSVSRQSMQARVKIYEKKLLR